MTAPVGVNLVTKTSLLPPGVLCEAPAVVGKSAEVVSPTTYTLPWISTAILRPWSLLVPPQNVE